MTTKAIIEDKLEGNKIKIRIPFLDGAEGTKGAIQKNNLNYATMCVLANSLNNYNIGDVVYITFEDNDLSRPVILGHLLTSEELTTLIDLVVNNLTIKGQLSTSTFQLDKVTEKEISYLSNCTGNIQRQIDELSKKVEQLGANK